MAGACFSCLFMMVIFLFKKHIDIILQYVILSDSCRKLNREKHVKEYCVKYRKEKRQSVLISKDDNKLLEKISSVCGMSKTKINHAMIVEIYGENNF